MKLNIILLSGLLALLSPVPPVHTQTLGDHGVFAGAGFNVHDASFSKLGTYPSCCPEFTGGSGLGFYAGGWWGVQLSPRISLLGRLSFSTESGTMTDDEQSFVADLRDTAKVVEATFTHQLDANLSSIGIEPLLAFRAFGGFDVIAGARIGLVVASNFHQTETLTKPDDYGTYLGSGRVWVDTQADIPDASSLRATLVGGLRYILPVGKGRKTFLAPELTYHLPLTGVASGVSWNVAQLRLGIALGWMRFEDPPAELPAPVPPPPPVLIVPPPVVSLHTIGTMPDGTIIDPASVSVEETKITTLHPFLGHVYFDEGESVLPQRYVSGIERALADTTQLTPLQATHGELAIIAQRMKSNPSATLRLIGTIAGTPADNAPQLAKQRAETVRDKLVALGVASNRITVGARGTPQYMTRASEPELAAYAAAENQRVEITSSPTSLMAPVALGSVDVSYSPPLLTFNATAHAAAGLQTASLRVTRNAAEAAIYPTVPLGSSTHMLDLEALDFDGATQAPYLATLSVTDSSGVRVVTVDTIPVRRRSAQRSRIEDLGDAHVERFALILFEFNDVTLRGENSALLEYIQSRIRPGTTVKIIGSTDIIGSDAYNSDLSLRRAREVARLLRFPNPTIVGRGETDPMFPNELPEGRGLNRTVIIELTHPLP